MSEKKRKKLYARVPSSPGVYLMRGTRGKVLYIGKAANLKRRVSSYFAQPHDARIEQMVRQVKRIDCEKTDTALEALMLEATLIKKYLPPYNIREKDNTSYLYVQITKEEFPRLVLARGRGRSKGGLRAEFGPFTAASSVREALRIIQKIFPYNMHSVNASIRKDTNDASDTERRPCFNYQIGLCPGTCVGAISRQEYLKTVRKIKLLFEGKRKQVVRELEREMKEASKALAFEKAARLRKQVFALKHVQDIALIKESSPIANSGLRTTRIEGYDISNISGTSATGSMVVFVGGASDKSEYRKFKIRTVLKSDDVGMLTEVLRRRFSHNWPLPDVILVDGGRGQVNAARAVLEECGLRIPVVGIAKGPTRKKNEFVGDVPRGVSKKTLIEVRDEAHRFAIQYHRKLRDRI